MKTFFTQLRFERKHGQINFSLMKKFASLHFYNHARFTALITSAAPTFTRDKIKFSPFYQPSSRLIAIVFKTLKQWKVTKLRCQSFRQFFISHSRIHPNDAFKPSVKKKKKER